MSGRNATQLPGLVLTYLISMIMVAGCQVSLPVGLDVVHE